MVTCIYNVDSETGSGEITFWVDVDNSADETVSTEIDDETFETTVQKSGAGSSSHSIAHNKAGLRTIVLTARLSPVRSDSVLLDL